MSRKNIWNYSDDSDLTGYSLIIPSVAVGNVGQLACDLLISSLHMKKIASVYSRALVPVLGYDPYDLKSGRISSCCEVYKSTEVPIAVLQLRAPLVYKYAREFLNELIQTFKERHIKDFIVLTSSFAHEKKHVFTSPFRYIANDLCTYKSEIETLGWLEHESTDGRLNIHGGGFASLLYSIVDENKMPCIVLYKYCSEGDNIPDAYDMIIDLSRIIPIIKAGSELSSALVQPVSWKLLFGRPPPSDIY